MTEPETLETFIAKMAPIERLRLLVATLKKIPEDIGILMEASDDPEVAKQVSELAIQLMRTIPEIQKRMAVEALKRVGIL